MDDTIYSIYRFMTDRWGFLYAKHHIIIKKKKKNSQSASRNKTAKKCCFKGFNRIKKLTNGVILCYSKETIVMITIFHALLIKKATERIQFGWVSCVRMMKKGGGVACTGVPGK